MFRYLKLKCIFFYSRSHWRNTSITNHQILYLPVNTLLINSKALTLTYHRKYFVLKNCCCHHKDYICSKMLLPLYYIAQKRMGSLLSIGPLKVSAYVISYVLGWFMSFNSRNPCPGIPLGWSSLSLCPSSLTDPLSWSRAPLRLSQLLLLFLSVLWCQIYSIRGLSCKSSASTCNQLVLQPSPMK